MTLRQGRLHSMKADRKHLIWGSLCLFLLTMALSAVLLPPAVSAAKSKVIARGYCGWKDKETGEKRKDLKWELRKNGTMVISGKGSMQGYALDISRPAWWNLRKKIKKVVFKEGVDYVGQYNFYKCRNLKEIVWAESITVVAEGAFWGCTGLKEVELSREVKKWGQWAFFGSGVEELTIPASDTYWGHGVFFDNASLRKVIFENGVEFETIKTGNYQNSCSGSGMFGKCTSL